MQKTPTTTHDGKVVSVVGDKLTTTGSEGKQRSHTVAKDAKVIHDGKPIKLADLKAGTEVRVTTHADDETTATAIRSGKPAAGAGHKA